MIETTICPNCDRKITDEFIAPNGWCVDCFTDHWGKIVEESPMCSPEMLMGNHE